MPSFYEFFAGGGMARAGLGSGWRCLFANDIDLKKSASYARNWGDKELHVGDIYDLTTAALPGNVELAWASFPCQDLSLAGSGGGLAGKRSGTFWPFWRLIEGLRAEGRGPATVVLENVCGALTSHGGKDFAAIGDAIASSGYRFGALVIDAVHFLPQSRPRLFILALRDDLDVPATLASTWPDRNWHTKTLLGAHLRLSPASRARWIWWQLPHPPKRTTVLADLIEEEPEGVKWHTSEETQHVLGLMSEVNLEKLRVAQTAGRRLVGAIYRRTRPDGNGSRAQRAEIRFDGVAGCLRTPVGGSSRQTIVVVSGESVRTRLLSPREAARLMGLPDKYQLPDRYNEAYHIAGDGLAVPVVRHLAAHLIEPLVAAARPAEREAA